MQNIILTGFMGTGKTTVGQLLAERLQRPFIDTDDLIVARDGRSIADIFAQDGEAAFRAWERTVALELAQRQGLVIATGGRLMLNEKNAAALAASGQVFCLTAVPQTILARVQDETKRPLLNVPNPAAQIQRLLDERKEGYGRFRQIHTDGKTAGQIAEEIIVLVRGGKIMGFLDIANRLHKELLPGLRVQSFWGEQMLVITVELVAGTIVPQHNHLHEQAGTVISGDLSLTIAGETRRLKPGDAYIIPGDVPHSAEAHTDTRLFELFSPVREEYKY